MTQQEIDNTILKLTLNEVRARSIVVISNFLSNKEQFKDIYLPIDDRLAVENLLSFFLESNHSAEEIYEECEELLGFLGDYRPDIPYEVFEDLISFESVRKLVVDEE